MPDEEAKEDAANAPSLEYLALLKDLNQYDHPEIFFDLSLPLEHAFRVVSSALPDLPEILHIQINGENLPRALREALLGVFDSNTRERLGEDYGTRDWEETRAAILTDKEYRDLEEKMYWFFIRHFPKLAVQLYEIAMLMSVVFAIVLAMDERPGSKEVSELVKRNLAIAVRKLENESKRIFGTRRRGGSKAKIPPEKRRQLHIRYDDLHAVAKRIKRDYNAVFKRFAESRRHRGYTHEDWQNAWNSYAVAIYPEYDTDFLALFADEDKLSPSEVAYRRLAQETDHKRGYVERLVRKSRRSARKSSPKPRQ